MYVEVNIVHIFSLKITKYSFSYISNPFSNYLNFYNKNWYSEDDILIETKKQEKKNIFFHIFPSLKEQNKIFSTETKMSYGRIRLML